MRFLNREHELERLDALVARGRGFAVVYGRRRIGKTRLLVEWVRRHGGVYTVADQSAAEVQRRYLAEAIAVRLPGFADVAYRDWRSLLTPERRALICCTCSPVTRASGTLAMLGPARLFDLASLAFPLLSAAERNRFLRNALIVDHGLRRGTLGERPIVDTPQASRNAAVALRETRTVRQE